MDGLKLETVSLMGYSTGGGVACYLASRDPERIKRLIVIGNGGAVEDTRAGDDLPEALIRDGKWDFIERVQQLHADSHRGNWQEYCGMEVNDWKNHPRLTAGDWKRMTMPLLLIAGEHDCFATEERLMKIQKTCPQAEIYNAKDCGHGAHMPTQSAKEVNARMLDVLSQ